MLPRRLSTGISYASPGSKIHQVNILLPLVKDDSGNYSMASPPYLASGVWASIIAMRGQEALKQDQIVQKQIYQVIITYVPGLEEDMLMQLADGRVFQIDYIEDPDNRKIEHRIMCSETNINA
jgi:SPP1 family predicted phage head-tail adaptor